MTLLVLLRVAGASLIVLSLFHVVLWRALDWGEEIAKLSKLTARVFMVHTFFIAFVLCALGLLSLASPELLLTPGKLPRLLLMAIALFWIARLLIQPLVFDGAMTSGWTRVPLVRVGAVIVWLSYVAIYGAALVVQWRAVE